MKKILKQILFLICLTGILVLPYLVLAEDSAAGPLDKLRDVGISGGYAPATETSLADTVGKIITAALSLIGVIFLVLAVYAGFLWMTARGNEEQVKKARDILTMAIIGLVIVIGAYAITRFVFTYIIQGAGVLR